MSKIKKIIAGIIIFISGIVKETMAKEVYEITSMYAVEPFSQSNSELTPVPPPTSTPTPDLTQVSTITDIILKIVKIMFPIVLFLIGFFIVMNKKITKKVKIIVVLLLIIVTIASIILMRQFL